METEIINKPSGRKITLILLITALTAFLIYFLIMSMISPGRKLNEIKYEYNSKSKIDSSLYKKISSDSTYLKLLREKAFLQSRTVMAESDSIYLTINLSDSTVNVEISGVAVQMAKMSDVQTSNIFLNGDENIILALLSSPFTIANSIATIKKEPVMLKMAPKDTADYIPDIMPDTSITEPVNYVLEMTDGTRIYVYQEEAKKFKDRMSIFRFDLKYRLRDTWSSLKSVALFKVPEYHLFIKIKLPRADAKIIYRAIPKYGQVGIYR